MSTTKDQALTLLRQAHDALDGMADSDLDHFEDEEDEAEAVPAQYAARKVMAAIQLLSVPDDAHGPEPEGE